MACIKKFFYRLLHQLAQLEDIFRNQRKSSGMRPTVDNVCSRWRSLYLETLIVRVYLLHVGCPWLPKTSAFSIFPIFLLQFFDQHRLQACFDTASNKDSGPYLRQVLPRTGTFHPGMVPLMLDG